MAVDAVSRKRPNVTVGTHSGTFHCDEALGCWLLSQTSQYKSASVVRTRDAALLSSLDIIIDVGGVYEPASCRFDHHQRGFGEVFGHGFNTKLSSAGLVYKHFGKEIIVNIMGISADHPDVQTVYLQVYKNFIEGVDAVDNGINQYESDKPPRYINNTTLSARVAKLNPQWNESSTDEILDANFQKAMVLTGTEFLESVNYVAKCWLPAKAIVAEAILARDTVDPSGQIIRLRAVAPWKEHLYDLEQELDVIKPILFCLYEDDRDKSWRVQAVSVAPGSFENRKTMPAAWLGLRDDKLSEVSGIPGCVFVHANGFIGGNSTYEGALEMARRSVLEP
eukprot:jgi/Chrzof1/12150/Cz06g22300.t1